MAVLLDRSEDWAWQGEYRSYGRNVSSKFSASTQRRMTVEDGTLKKVLGSLVVTAIVLATMAGCSKSSSDNDSAKASPPAKMAYTGSTDTSTGGTASAAPAAAGPVSPGDAVHGKQVFTENCSSCHGASGTEGGVGPSLKGEKSKKDLAATVAWIKNPTPPMPKLYPSPLNEKDVVDVATYVQSL